MEGIKNVDEFWEPSIRKESTSEIPQTRCQILQRNLSISKLELRNTYWVLGEGLDYVFSLRLLGLIDFLRMNWSGSYHEDDRLRLVPFILTIYI